ncbi:YrzQ family protein [Pontibacillus salicampi]|uniref:YrzQ family protein n=1 Tax=Pontibacillus salicampi TaxID=1449801 RepID=A0ABV6LJN0_9BACI
MNRTFTSLMALGLGAAVYSRSRRGKDNTLFSQKSMKRMRKRVRKAFR